jgi:hypothetical protein
MVSGMMRALSDSMNIAGGSEEGLAQCSWQENG